MFSESYGERESDNKKYNYNNEIINLFGDDN